MDISGHTRIACIIADPIGHVKTPEHMNGFFREQGIDGVVVPAHVRPQELAAAIQGLRHINSLAGLIVTVPHKIDIMALCDHHEESARIAGAANVVRRTPEGLWVAANFDGMGQVRAIIDHIGSVEGMSVYMAGAGGVARAIAFSLAGAGIARLAIHNRSEHKTLDLVRAVRQRYPDVDVQTAGTHPCGFDIALNATTVGMAPGDTAPFFIDGLGADCLVADVIMSPLMTPLLMEARARGLRICTGDGMLKHQLRAFAEFLGFTHPGDGMDGVGNGSKPVWDSAK